MDDLAPLPDEDAIVATVRELQERPFGATANTVARRLGVQSARRHGNGAVKGSWSGQMSAGLRLSPRLRAMVRRGLLREWQGDGRYEYTTPDARA